jgi:hypothetical protein
MNKIIWKLFGKWMLSQHLKSSKKSIALSDLEFAFIAPDGMKYYRFPANVQMPFVRLSKQQEYLIYLSSALSSNELEMICEHMDKALTDGLTNGKNAAKIGSLVSQIRERKTKCVHTELMINMLALTFIREDEQPAIFDNEIQMQKVEMFLNEADKIDSFFFHLPELTILLDSLNLTGQRFSELHRIYKVQEKILKESMKIYS